MKQGKTSMQRTPLWLGGLLMLLPTLVLVPMGLVWLWQHGWLLPWLAISAGLAGSGYALARWQQRRPQQQTVPGSRLHTQSYPFDETGPRDLAAWHTVQRLAQQADPTLVTDRQRLLDVAQETIEAVARHYHPGSGQAVWQFTVPEALLLNERLSQRLRQQLLEQVPGVHHIRVGQVRQLWSYRPLATHGRRWLGVASRAWRVARWANPVHAALAEVRDRLLGAAWGQAGEYLRRQGARIWVEEVGRAAIELYSGRLKLAAMEQPPLQDISFHPDTRDSANSSDRHTDTAREREWRRLARQAWGARRWFRRS